MGEGPVRCQGTSGPSVDGMEGLDISWMIHARFGYFLACFFTRFFFFFSAFGHVWVLLSIWERSISSGSLFRSCGGVVVLLILLPACRLVCLLPLPGHRSVGLSVSWRR